ncbi:uncharacterized protein LOC108042191 isoform X2 [Drosophila rhopaloa]|uniref:Serine-rich adhesin for platelets n=1 Tax=Drosophila rhopaloa TaxID=1041015 RepID=A0ABM5J3L3_DRORH|nr:uncharacterized protein LOC108042191 isoform X2 [Drosophila rhopaloa]
MTTETYSDLTYERGKVSKRSLRPKLLKLTDVTIPHRNRKKNKVKTKDRSATSVRERIYDDPAYTEDISHLANPMRRNSISGKPLSEHKVRSDTCNHPSSSSRSVKNQLTNEFHEYVTGKHSKTKASAASGSTAISLNYECDSSSTDNEPLVPSKGSMTRRVRSLERSLVATASERVEKKGTHKRNSKQKRNLSLDNSRQLPAGYPPRETGVTSKHGHDFDIRPCKERSRKHFGEGATEVAPTEVSELDDGYSARSSAQDSAATVHGDSAASKVDIGKRFLRGEIGIKSFNYYLIKEGLKSSKKIVDQQRNSSGLKADKRHSRSEENIYEEIFFKETPSTVSSTVSGAATGNAMSVASAMSDKDVHNHRTQKIGAQPHGMSATSEGNGSAVDAFPGCEICMEQCRKDNCEYCLAHVGSVESGKLKAVQPQQEQYVSQRHQQENTIETRTPPTVDAGIGLPAAHILEFQSYNPNNPGVYKIETTPVAITGDYNPILQFQQSSATTSTSANTTPSEQQQQKIYDGYYLPHQRPYQSPIASNPLPSHYAVGDSLLLAQVAGPASGCATPPRRPQQQLYIVGYQNGGGSVAGAASLQRLNTKSSSSSDSLPYHKYNTMARLEANVFAAPTTGDFYYAVSGTQPLHPLMYAANRPIGGSQILVDPYDPQIYKSDSKASILSEFSLRSSDNSQRYSRHPHRRHGGRASDSSLFSVYSNSGQTRYFGSSEGRFGYDCRRCSLDGVIGMGSAAGLPMAASDKCSYSDNCRYECRNCDCSSNYFSSDFDDVYGSTVRGGSSGIPRKTAAGILPSSGQDEPAELLETGRLSIDQQQYAAPLDLKQNKYAQDFFKHVNDVKRSIYQSEMQRNNSLEPTRRGPRASSNTSSNPKTSPKASQEPWQEPVVTTLPLSRGRPTAGVKPTPAPRTSLQGQTPIPDGTVPKDPTPSKRKGQPTGRREYPSLDRLVASSTGTIPKRHYKTIAETDLQSLKLTPKARCLGTYDADKTNTAVDEQMALPLVKRHHRTSGSKIHQNTPGPSLRRKDVPAPPPPSPATYSDLQELKANMEGLQDDTKSRSLEIENNDLAVAEKSKQSEKKVVLVPSKRKLEPTTGGPDANAAETDDNDVFYDARSEDSTCGILPSEATVISKKSPSHMTQVLENIITNENRKAANDIEVAHSAEDVHTQPPAEPALERREQASTIAGKPEGNAINNGSDNTEFPKWEVGRPAEAQSQLDSLTCLRPRSRLRPRPSSSKLPPESRHTTVGENSEKTSKTKHDKQTPTNAPRQHVVPTCLEEQGTGGPATNVAPGISTTTNAGNFSASNSAVELEFSCKTGNTDSATIAAKHRDQTHCKTVALKDACLDSSEAQSDDSHLTRDSITRESQNDELSSSTHEKLDVSTLPLPALPKRRRTRSRTSPSKHLQQRLQQQRHEAVEDVNAADETPATAVHQLLNPRQRPVTPEFEKSEIGAQKSNAATQQQKEPNSPQQQAHLSAFQQYVAKRRESLEASNRCFNEKLEARNMHYHMSSSGANENTTGSNGVPTYLFGEHFHGVTGSGRKSISPATTKEEIFLNKSGWVQVNTKRGSQKDDSCDYRRLSYSQQNGGTLFPENGRGRTGARAIPPDHGRLLDLARQSFIQQHQPQQANVGMTEPKFVGSKVEELIQRNEARLCGLSSRDPALRPGYRIIDPQLANILNERPGFLPVKSPNDLDSPITPILSPPPAFQDNSRSARHPDRRKPFRQQGLLPLPVPLQTQTQLGTQQPNPGSSKGMVFSRSFEYDTRRPTPTDSYVETFSRSFDGNLSERPLNLAVLSSERERSPNFSTLTGNSPNYLTKRESGGGSSGSLRSRDNSPKYLHPQTTTAYMNAAVKEAPPVYSADLGSQAKNSPRSRHERTAERSKNHALGRSRKSHFSRVGSAGPLAAHSSPPNTVVSRFRSFDTSKSQRLNSCDSGARSDLSNDELDNEDSGLSEFLASVSHKFPKVGTSSVSISPFKMQRQRSLTPDRKEFHSSSSSIRKQRSLTPESRSLTPEERRKKGSQVSLTGSRQNSISKSNTLEARQRNEEKTPPNISRSSSSSSYSGGDSHEHHTASTSLTVTASTAVPGSVFTTQRRAIAAKQAEQEHRIRRSRSLQLTERSPNRTHKSIVNVSAVTAQQQQASGSSYQQPRVSGGGVFPATIRGSPAAAKIHVNPPAPSSNSVRVRQNEKDKARSFDFDYDNYNRSGGANNSGRNAHTSGSGGEYGSTQNLRVESRSFDDDFREAVPNNNNGSNGSVSVSGLRFLQTATDSGHVSMASTSSSRLRKSNSPVNASGMESSRSPQSSGSSSNNLHQPTRQSGSPQSYGTRLCDHELTYEMMRKSPIMNFRRGDSSDYELPVMLRNRETINSGGNSELNFMSNETRIYEHPTTVLKPQRSLRQSPGSRDDLTLEVAVGVGGDYIYRQPAAQPRSSRY